MKFQFVDNRLQVVESLCMPTLNPLREDPAQPIEAMSVADMSVMQVQCVYPMLKAINSGRLTGNFTLYERRSLVGKDTQDENSTGYSSFVRPWGKPIIREHNLQQVQGFFGPEGEADIPSGRIVFSSYVRRAQGETQTPHPKAGYPGTVEGDGYIMVVGAITLPEAVQRVLGSVYHTVSIGAEVESVVESISGVDLVKAYQNGDEAPEYRRGQMYDGKLSYWTMGPIRGKELSWVNNPSDTHAGVMQKDIGEYGLQLLLGQKKVGCKEFAMYDARTLERVLDSQYEGAWDTTYELEDSVQYAPDTVLVPTGAGGFMSTERVQNEPSISERTPPAQKQEQTQAMNVQELLKALEAEGTLAEKCQALVDALENQTEPIQGEAEDYAPLQALLSEAIRSELPALVEGNTKLVFSDEQAMQEATDRATTLVGEWNTESASLAVALYLADESRAVDLAEAGDQPVTIEQIWPDAPEHLKTRQLGLTLSEYRALGEDVLKYSVERNALAAWIEDQVSLPITTVLMQCQSDACKAAWEAVEDSVLIKTEEDLNKLEGLAETWSYDEASLKVAQETLREFKKLTETNLFPLLSALQSEEKAAEFDWSSIKFETQIPSPLLVTVEFFVQKYFQTEASTGVREYLAPLVGIVRKFQIDKQTLESAGKAMNYLGSGTLKRYLAQVPERTENTEAPDNDQSEGKPGPIQVNPELTATPESSLQSETETTPTAASLRSKLAKFRTENNRRGKVRA